MLDLSTVITAEMVQGVFDQIGDLIPIVIPVIVGFIGIRKGLGWLLGMIRNS